MEKAISGFLEDAVEAHAGEVFKQACADGRAGVPLAREQLRHEARGHPAASREMVLRDVLLGDSPTNVRLHTETECLSHAGYLGDMGRVPLAISV